MLEPQFVFTTGNEGASPLKRAELHRVLLGMCSDDRLVEHARRLSLVRQRALDNRRSIPPALFEATLVTDLEGWVRMEEVWWDIQLGDDNWFVRFLKKCLLRIERIVRS